MVDNLNGAVARRAHGTEQAESAVAQVGHIYEVAATRVSAGAEHLSVRVARPLNARHRRAVGSVGRRVAEARTLISATAATAQLTA